MITTKIKLASLLVWTILVFIAGREWRDRSADIDTAETETKTEKTRADHAINTRATDHADAGIATATETKRVADSGTRAIQFRTIDRKVIEYVQSNPDTDDCVLDGVGMRAWREANAGRVDEAGLDHSAGTTGAMPRATPAGER